MNTGRRAPAHRGAGRPRLGLQRDRDLGSAVRVSLEGSVPAGTLPTSGGNLLTVDQVPADAAVSEPIRVGATVH